MFVAVEYENVVYKSELILFIRTQQKSLLNIHNFGITSLHVAEKPINVNT